MTNPMTEKQAWWTMAVAYGTEREERDEEQRRLTTFGICWAIGWTCLQWTLSDLMTKKVMRDVRLGGFGGVFCYCTPANDALRADYCLLNYYMLGGTKC